MTESTDTGVTRAEYCAVACAEVFRGDGEVMASAFGTAPALGARIARLTFAPDLVLTDGDAALVAGAPPLGARPSDLVLESHMPYRRVFDVVWSGRRNLIMMASQIDRTGNQNISAIGPWAQPKAQLVGVRGAPGNTVNHTTSYWVPNHSPGPSSTGSTWSRVWAGRGRPRRDRRPPGSTRSGTWCPTSACSTSPRPTR